MKTKVAIYLSLIALLGAILFQNIDTMAIETQRMNEKLHGKTCATI